MRIARRSRSIGITGMGLAIKGLTSSCREIVTVLVFGFGVILCRRGDAACDSVGANNGRSNVGEIVNAAERAVRVVGKRRGTLVLGACAGCGHVGTRIIGAQGRNVGRGGIATRCRRGRGWCVAVGGMRKGRRRVYGRSVRVMGTRAHALAREMRLGKCWGKG
jgi:hypothetical protein